MRRSWITGSSLNLDSKGNIDVRMNVPALAAGGVTPADDHGHGDQPERPVR
jgi:hypothetical protein